MAFERCVGCEITLITWIHFDKGFSCVIRLDTEGLLPCYMPSKKIYLYPVMGFEWPKVVLKGSPALGTYIDAPAKGRFTS